MSAAHGVTLPGDEQLRIGAGHSWARLPMVAFVLGALGIGGTFALGMGKPQQMYSSYLVAYMYFLSIALGSLFFVMVQFLSRSGWSVVVRRIAENLSAAVGVFVLLFIPIAVGMHDLYHWSHHDAVAHDAILKWKEPYLNAGFFYGRAAFYFLTWILLSVWFRNQSVAQDKTGDPAHTRRMQIVAAPGTFAFALTMTFAAVDWVMSLNPHWFSTMWGVWFFAGGLVSTYALLVVLVMRMQSKGLLSEVVSVEHFHDLGKLCFAFTVFWTYISFSQYFLIWYANIPEETVYFQMRMGNSWENMGIFLMVGHFVIPFFFLLPRTIKRNRATLFVGASWILFMHFIDLYYAVKPNFDTAGVAFGPMDLLAMLGVGGIYMGTVLTLMRRAPLIPTRDPRLSESLAFENF